MTTVVEGAISDDVGKNYLFLVIRQLRPTGLALPGRYKKNTLCLFYFAAQQEIESGPG